MSTPPSVGPPQGPPPPLPPNFDPYAQTFMMQSALDHYKYPFSVADLDFIIQYGVKTCINIGTQIGASIVMLIVLLIVTRKDKMKSPIFIINAFCMVLNIIRTLTSIVYFTSPYFEAYTLLSYDPSAITPGDISTSITSGVFGLLVLMAIEASLFVQVYAVCVLMKPLIKIGLLGLSAAIALVAIGFRFALVVLNAKALASNAFFGDLWLQAASPQIIAASFCYFSLVFSCKLVLAIRERRRLGVRQFGPLQVIFIMSCQTMIVPAIFSILEISIINVEFSTQTLTSAALFLPLSGLWAAASNDTLASTVSFKSSGKSRLLGSYSSKGAKSGTTAASTNDGYLEKEIGMDKSVSVTADDRL